MKGMRKRNKENEQMPTAGLQHDIEVRVQSDDLTYEGSGECDVEFQFLPPVPDFFLRNSFFGLSSL